MPFSNKIFKNKQKDARIPNEFNEYIDNSGYKLNSKILTVFNKIVEINHVQHGVVPFRSLYVKILNNNIETGINKNSWGERNNIFIESLDKIISGYNVPDCEFIINTDDECFIDFEFPVFSYTKRIQDPRNIYLCPLETLLTKYEFDKFDDIYNKSLEFPWNTRISNVYFVGQVSNPVRKLMEKSEFDIFLEPKIHMPFTNSYKYKYILNMDGNGPAFRVPELFMTGCCVIMLELKNNWFICDFSDQFIPGVHYIKVEYTFQDTVDDIDIKLKKAIKHFDGSKIALNGTKKAREYFTSNNVIKNFYHTIKLYVEDINKKNYNINLSKYTKNMKMKKYTFIHPTKSGGTAIQRYFKKYYQYYIAGPDNHKHKCKNDNNPIIIVRDVKSRFISIFNYWKNGAIDTSFKRNNNFINKNKDITVLDFISILKSDKTKLYKDFTWNHHFSSTSEWFGNTNYENIIIIEYVDDLNGKIQKLLNSLNIPNKNISLPRINISVPPTGKDKLLFENPEVDKFIQEYFKDDIKLINTIKNNPKLFKLVI